MMDRGSTKLQVFFSLLSHISNTNYPLHGLKDMFFHTNLAFINIGSQLLECCHIWYIRSIFINVSVLLLGGYFVKRGSSASLLISRRFLRDNSIPACIRLALDGSSGKDRTIKKFVQAITHARDATIRIIYRVDQIFFYVLPFPIFLLPFGIKRRNQNLALIDNTNLPVVPKMV